MIRSLVSMATALLTFLIGVAFVPPGPVWKRNPSEYPMSRPNAEAHGAVPLRLNFAEVFRGFNFVGSSASSRECACPHALKESRPFPEMFDAGHTYAFHSRDTTDTDLLFEALQARLRSFDFETGVSGSVSGMRVHPDVLTFEGQGYAGRIVCSSHRTVSKDGWESFSTSVYDFTLFFAKESQ